MIAEFRYFNFDMEIGLTVYASDVNDLMEKIKRYDITPENIVSLSINLGKGEVPIHKSIFNKWFMGG